MHSAGLVQLVIEGAKAQVRLLRCERTARRKAHRVCMQFQAHHCCFLRNMLPHKIVTILTNPSTLAARSLSGATGRTDSPTLIIYVYANSDPEYEQNLRYFMAEGMKANDGCDYLIVVQVRSCLLLMRWSTPCSRSVHTNTLSVGVMAGRWYVGGV